MKRIMAAAFLAAGLWCGAARAEDCPACKPGKLCPAHDAADDAAVKEAAAGLKNKDADKRCDAIDVISNAAAKHLNARSRKLTNEILRMMQSDPEPVVKGHAALRLGQVGDEPTAAAALAAEAEKQSKTIPTEKPGKEADAQKFEENLRLVGYIFQGLGSIVTQPAAAAGIAKGITASSPWVSKVAAENCKGFKKSKVVMKALVDALANYYTKVATDATSAAWVAISLALPEVSGCNDIPGQKDTDAGRWNAAWQKWWRENEKTLK